MTKAFITGVAGTTLSDAERASNSEEKVR